MPKPMLSSRFHHGWSFWNKGDKGSKVNLCFFYNKDKYSTGMGLGEQPPPPSLPLGNSTPGVLRGPSRMMSATKGGGGGGGQPISIFF